MICAASWPTSTPTPVNAAPGEPLPERHRQTLGRQLRDRDPLRLDLLTHLAARLSLVKPDASPLRPDPQTRRPGSNCRRSQQQRALFEGWRDSVTWNDLWRVPTLRCEDTGSWRNDPLAARRAALDALAQLEPGAWYRLEDFVAAIREASPDFQRPGGDYDTWYIRDAATNQYLTGFESWDQVEGALLRFIVGGPLHWLGVVDVDADGAAFCVTRYWVLAIGARRCAAVERGYIVRRPCRWSSASERSPGAMIAFNLRAWPIGSPAARRTPTASRRHRWSEPKLNASRRSASSNSWSGRVERLCRKHWPGRCADGERAARKRGRSKRSCCAWPDPNCWSNSPTRPARASTSARRFRPRWRWWLRATGRRCSPRFWRWGYCRRSNGRSKR